MASASASSASGAVTRIASPRRTASAASMLWLQSASHAAACRSTARSSSRCPPPGCTPARPKPTKRPPRRGCARRTRGEVHTGTDARTLHRGDGRDRHLHESTEHLVDGADAHERLGGEGVGRGLAQRGQVGAGAERLALGANEQRPDGRIGARLRVEVHEDPDHLGGHRVAAVGGVQGHHCDRAVDLVAHLVHLSSPRRLRRGP